MRPYRFVNGKIITPFDLLDDYVVDVVGSRICDICQGTCRSVSGDPTVIDLAGKYLCPGFIDIHNHGAMGIDFDNLPEDTSPTAQFLSEKGVTGFLLTTGSPPVEKIIKNLATARRIIEKDSSGAQAIGINMEGPYLNPKYGAQRDNTLVPKREEYEPIVETALPHLRLMTVPPEREGAYALISHLQSKGVGVAIGHSEASHEQIDYAILHGACLTTHIFDAFCPPVQTMKGVKAVGIEEYLMTREDLMAEVLPDGQGIHVHPILLRLLLSVKGKDKLILITDSTFPAGTRPTDEPDSLGRVFEIRDDLRFNKHNGDLSGSVLTLDRAVRNMMVHTDVSLKDAVLMASHNPAKLLRLDSRKGSIRVGMDADLVVIDENVNVHLTMVAGKVVFNRLAGEPILS